MGHSRQECLDYCTKKGGTFQFRLQIGIEIFDNRTREVKNARGVCFIAPVRKEVIQPQVLLQLPCYDFTPIMDHTVGNSLPEGLGRRLLVQPTFVM